MTDLKQLAQKSLRKTHLVSQESDTEFLNLEDLQKKINTDESFTDSLERGRLVDQVIAMLHGQLRVHAHARGQPRVRSRRGTVGAPKSVGKS